MSKRTSRVKGQGNVYMRSYSPYWQISYWNGWRQQRESSRTKDYAEAVKTLQRKLGEIAVGKSAGAERIRVSALLQLVVEDYRLHDRADLCEVEQSANRLLKPHFGQTLPMSLPRKRGSCGVMAGFAITTPLPASGQHSRMQCTLPRSFVKSRVWNKSINSAHSSRNHPHTATVGHRSRGRPSS